MSKEIPYFIQMRGCINCSASKLKKKKTGKEYGFDHEIMAKCILMGCQSIGFCLVKPFVDPEEIVIRLADEGNNPETIKRVINYYKEVDKLCGKCFREAGINIDKIFADL